MDTAAAPYVAVLSALRAETFTVIPAERFHRQAELHLLDYQRATVEDAPFHFHQPELLRFELFVRRRLALARTFDENEIDRAFYLLRNRLVA